MQIRTLKLRSRRFWRRRLVRLVGWWRSAGEQFDNNLIGRLGRLRLVWRFVLAWTLLFIALGGLLFAQLGALRSSYQIPVPAPGGTYSEGLEGSFTTASPLYAVSDVDTTVSRLVFASLLTYDTQNHLIGDLADRWSANASGTVYTVHLRPGLTWQDGQPLTAADVVFTYQTIQNPDAGSPLQSSWQGVNVQAVDARTVTFSLPNPLSSFPYGLTNGIVPEHILHVFDAADLRSASFNTDDPVGAGPFVWHSLGQSGIGPSAETQIILAPFKHYWAGQPRLSEFDVYAFASRSSLIKAYTSKQLTAIAGLPSVPPAIAKDKSSHIYSLPLTAGTYVFFRTDSPALSDPAVRRALVAAADPAAATKSLGYSAIPVDEPLLRGQLGYNPAYAQQTGAQARAEALLTAAGWRTGADGLRHKRGRTLGFSLTVLDTPEYVAVANALRDQWHAVGAAVTVDVQPASTFQGELSPPQGARAYDAVLDGIAIGVDPDVFVYWDSSQADIRSANVLNFSDYRSGTVDAALEAGRTRLDPTLRAIKYQPFLKAWQQDAPALGLYQPRLLYVTHVLVHGLTTGQINTDADRLNNVQDWAIHTTWVTLPAAS